MKEATKDMVSNVINNHQHAFVPNMDITELEQSLFDAHGKLKLLPAAELMQFGFSKLRLFIHKHSIYQMPTVELIDILRGVIGDASCIEIGAGSGNVGRHLNIKMTDSHQQAKKIFKELYESINQPIIQYPRDVEKLTAKEAIKLYRPHTVLGCWVTHKYNARLHHLGGNIEGIEGADVMKRVKRFVFVGNTEIHKGWNFNQLGKVEIIQSNGIVSRAIQGQNVVVVITKS